MSYSKKFEEIKIERLCDKVDKEKLKAALKKKELSKIVKK